MKHALIAALAGLGLTACDVAQTQGVAVVQTPGNAVVQVQGHAAVRGQGEFYTINDLRAVVLPDGLIEIKGRPTKTKDAYWCAVGDFARRGLGLSWNDRIYVVRGIGAAKTGGARSAVHFTATPEKLGVAPYEANLVLDVLTPGYSRAVNSARGYCRDWIFPPWFD